MNILEYAVARKLAGGGSGGDGGILVCDVENPNKRTQLHCLSDLKISFPLANVIEESAFGIGISDNIAARFDAVDLPNVTNIGNSAFERVVTLKSVNAPNLETIGDEAFSGCKLLETIIAPNVTTVGRNAFNACPTLGEFDFTNVTTLGYHSFYDTGLKSIYVPNITEVPEGAFAMCVLENVNLPNVTIIGERAFDCATKPNMLIKKIDLPRVKAIGSFAFAGLEKLSALILRTTETVCVCEFSALESTPIENLQGHIYVPASMYEYYRAGYADALNAAYAEMGVSGAFDIMFRKIEDYPEICG